MIGSVGGVLATVLKIPATMSFTSLFGESASTQDSWSSAAQGGILSVVASFLFLGVLTPVAEEMFFRGVITTLMLRYGSIVGVFGSTVIFALLHGEPILMISAVLVGLPAAELRQRSGSIWPGMALHIVFDLLSSVGLFIALPLLGG